MNKLSWGQGLKTFLLQRLITLFHLHMKVLYLSGNIICLHNFTTYFKIYELFKSVPRGKHLHTRRNLRNICFQVNILKISSLIA